MGPGPSGAWPRWFADLKHVRQAPVSQPEHDLTAVGRVDSIVYQNDFSAPLGAEWFRYNGVPACCPTSRWDAANAVVQGGRLVLRGLRQPDGTYHTAGVSLPHVNVTYGRVRFRGRFDKGLGLKMCALLWPAAGFQPPEIDFAESRTEDADRTTMCMTLALSADKRLCDPSRDRTGLLAVAHMGSHVDPWPSELHGGQQNMGRHRGRQLWQGRGSDDADALRNSDHDGVARQGEAGRDDPARGQPAHRRRHRLEIQGLKHLYRVQVFHAISRSSSGTASGSTRVRAAGASERRKSTTPA